MTGINLHNTVRQAVNALHPDIDATLYRSTGQVVDKGGSVKSVYAEGVSVKVQMQSEGPTTLDHTDRVGMEEVSRKLYLFSNPALDERVAGIVRPLSRNGDMLGLDDGTWWLVDNIIEDFTRSGWASVRASLQVIPPDFSNSDWSEQDDPD